MEHFTERGISHLEVLDKISSKYGKNAKILTRKNITMGGFLGLFKKEGVEYTGYVYDNVLQDRAARDSFEKKAILNSVGKSDIPPASAKPAGDPLAEEVKSLTEVVKTLIERGPATSEPKKHENLVKLEDLLEENDFSRDFIRDMIDRLKRELSLEDLDDYSLVQQSVLEWIGDKISIYREKPARVPRVFILVGPTGVGKTTTIAKLAAIKGIATGDQSPLSVRMITIDNYRIGAKKQIETYGDIMGIPVACVETFSDLEKKIQQFSDADLILVDTIGKSPSDFMKLAEMRKLLAACGSNSEVHLAVSSTTKTRDIREILSQFEPFKYQSVILTKLDETSQVGNLISLMAEAGKPLSYITDGQVVPQDIETATEIKLLEKLTGFSVDREKLLRKFPIYNSAIWR
ncbi:MAG: flagellar biosynthesis protein FlhF [Spirochaetales bacterium]|nr:flagellar biosynthesis protein FlhF [Spirochaetales bacterium]